MELPKRLGLRIRAFPELAPKKGGGNPGECLLVAGRRLGLIEVAIEAVLGDAKKNSQARSLDLEMRKAPRRSRVANGTNALVFGHERRGLAPQTARTRAAGPSSRSPMFLVMGSGLGMALPPVPKKAWSERSNAF